jgi:hypothetical protein
MNRHSIVFYLLIQPFIDLNPGAPKWLPPYLLLTLSFFHLLTQGTLLYASLNVVARSYNQACLWNCMPEYKLIQKKKKKKSDVDDTFPLVFVLGCGVAEALRV